MPKVSRDSATQGGEFGPVVDRSDDLDGYTVNFTSFSEDIDATPLMKGLPDDRCQQRPGRRHHGWTGKRVVRAQDLRVVRSVQHVVSQARLLEAQGRFPAGGDPSVIERNPAFGT